MTFRIFALVILCLWHSLVAEFQFSEYLPEQVKNFIGEISEEFPPVDQKEYQEIKKELAELLKEKQWAKGLAKSKTILTYPHRDAAALIDVAIFAYHGAKNIKKRNYEYSQLCEYAAYLAFMHSESNVQKAQAFLLYLSQNSWKVTGPVLEEIKQLYPIEKIRTEDLRFKDILKFEYLNHEIEETPEGAILRLNFSQSLKIEQPENYPEISPIVDGFIQTNGSQISVSGFQAGIEYSVKVKPGITSMLDEKNRISNRDGIFCKRSKTKN